MSSRGRVVPGVAGVIALVLIATLRPAAVSVAEPKRVRHRAAR
jgi:hypothetical protein